MRAIRIIFRREVGQYFASPVAYLIAFAFLLLTALFFNNDLRASVLIKPADTAIVPSFLSFAMVFFAPLLTMRLLAEESREGTLELLMTAPVKDSSIVFGKFLSAWFYYTILLLTTLLYLILLQQFIETNIPDLGKAVAAYLGIWLYGGATIAVGVMFSAMSENQIVAAFLSMSTLLFLWLGELAGDVINNIELANVIRKVTLQGHFAPSFAFGIVRFEDVVYFGGIMVITLFISIRIVESRRWR